MGDAPRAAAQTPTSVTLTFLPSLPEAEEYSLEYSMSENTDYQEGKRVYRRASVYLYSLTQSGLRVNTMYRFRIVPFLEGLRGRESPVLLAATSKYTYCIVYMGNSETGH